MWHYDIDKDELCAAAHELPHRRVPILKALGEIERLTLETLQLTRLRRLIMATLADIKANNAALVTAAAAEDTVIGAAVTLITGLNAQVSSLQAQLAAAIANNDPATIQSVSDSLAATVKDVQAQTQALSAAVPQNTSAPTPTSTPTPTPPPADTTGGTGGADTVSGGAAS